MFKEMEKLVGKKYFLLMQLERLFQFSFYFFCTHSKNYLVCQKVCCVFSFPLQ